MKKATAKSQARQSHLMKEPDTANPIDAGAAAASSTSEAEASFRETPRE